MYLGSIWPRKLDLSLQWCVSWIVLRRGHNLAYREWAKAKQDGCHFHGDLKWVKIAFKSYEESLWHHSHGRLITFRLDASGQSCTQCVWRKPVGLCKLKLLPQDLLWLVYAWSRPLREAAPGAWCSSWALSLPTRFPIVVLSVCESFGSLPSLLHLPVLPRRLFLSLVFSFLYSFSSFGPLNF